MFVGVEFRNTGPARRRGQVWRYDSIIAGYDSDSDSGQSQSGAGSVGGRSGTKRFRGTYGIPAEKLFHF